MSEPTKVLYIRRMPASLLNKARSVAALQGITLTEWVLRLFKRELPNGRK